jgi:hypothetical protein
MAYISISYAYTEQPWEEYRILLFIMICVTVTLTAQACGFFIGVITPFKVCSSSSSSSSGRRRRRRRRRRGGEGATVVVKYIWIIVCGRDQWFAGFSSLRNATDSSLSQDWYTIHPTFLHTDKSLQIQ